MTDVTVLGIRHHGPGSARAVAATLEELQPDAVLIEGPTELDAIVGMLADADAVPPLAALIYDPDHPARAVFYPFATFSPEYIAIRHALDRGVTVGFIDLPATNMLMWSAPEDGEHHHVRSDPLARLSEAAGFSDPERWWEDVLEHRHNGSEIFGAVSNAMSSLRESETHSTLTLTREAAMRKRIRAEIKSGAEHIAVVCGAWHAPVLDPERFPTIKSDTELLAGLAKTKVAATWVPWTSNRLSLRSGYGAGVASPAWYRHLFVTPGEDVVAAWMTRAARLLRSDGLDCSSAAVLEATRLASALATVRERPIAGLHELEDAAVAAMCDGSSVRFATIRERLYVGAELGTAPSRAPTVPLARNLDQEIKRLRLKKTAEVTSQELDLRKDSHLDKSRLFHRLAVLGIHWAVPTANVGRSLGTFRETWALEWKPEFEIAVVEASGFGSTVRAAAGNRLTELAEDLNLSELVGIIEHGMLADLPDAVDTALRTLQRRAASLDDIGALMDAVEPLSSIVRYSDVRGQDADLVAPVLEGIVTRIAIGLVAACASLDDEAAEDMHRRMESVHRGVGLIDDSEVMALWIDAVASLAAMSGVHGLVGGFAARLLKDRGRTSAEEAAAHVSRVLSPGTDPERAAAWLEGFLTGDALLLLHDHDLLTIIDAWLNDVAEERFDDLLPLLRRAFSRYSRTERRMIGNEVERLDDGGDRRSGSVAIDEARADFVMPTLELLLGPADE